MRICLIASVLLLSSVASADASASALLASGRSSLLTSAPVEYSQMTREQLLRKRAEIEDSKPSAVPNVLLLVLTPTIGAGLTILLGVLMWPAGLLIGAGICVAAIVTGIVLAVVNGPGRRRANVEMEIIDGLLESGQPLPNAVPAPPPTPAPDLPPPPPPPQGQNFVGPGDLIAVAAF